MTSLPLPGQTVHMMIRLGVLRVLWDMRRKEGRNLRELELYTTDATPIPSGAE